jgi:hypothetical protein
MYRWQLGIGMPADLTGTATSIAENGKSEALAWRVLSGWKISRAW